MFNHVFNTGIMLKSFFFTCTQNVTPAEPTVEQIMQQTFRAHAILTLMHAFYALRVSRIAHSRSRAGLLAVLDV